MASIMLTPVILSGGVGTRLWPMSRQLLPKQMLALTQHQGSLLQQAVQRAQQLPNIAAPIIVCNQAYRFMVAEQLEQIGVVPGHVLLEPVGRNTAPAIALAAWQALYDADLWDAAVTEMASTQQEKVPERQEAVPALQGTLEAVPTLQKTVEAMPVFQGMVSAEQDPLLLVLPADHHIETHALTPVVERARQAAAQGYLVTFGIVPTQPETGYGYIEVGQSIFEEIYQVLRFEEKPTVDRAQRFLESGHYYWNSGMFLLPAMQYLRALNTYAPEMATACRMAFEKRTLDLNWTVVDPQAFSTCPSDSIDYAVMEHTQQAVVAPFTGQWNDIGAWNAVYALDTPNAQGNVVHGRVELKEVTNSYVRANHRLVAGIGLQDMVVVETADAVLVMPKDRAQDVKTLVAALEARQCPEAKQHHRVYRPWGYYETLSQGEQFLVKKITVYPNSQLSLQTHRHRSEHWVVVCGLADVVRGDETFRLSPNASTYIPVGMRHRLSNHTSELLQVIEVQTGTYLAEDDIVRHEDQYARQ